MADAFISVDDNRLATQHCKDVPLRTNVRTSCAADAIRGVDVRMLGLGAIGAKLPLFHRLARLRLNFLSLPEVMKHEEQENDHGDGEGKSVVHKASTS
jgi:hypothetical protein